MEQQGRSLHGQQRAVTEAVETDFDLLMAGRTRRGRRRHRDDRPRLHRRRDRESEEVGGSQRELAQRGARLLTAASTTVPHRRSAEMGNPHTAAQRPPSSPSRSAFVNLAENTDMHCRERWSHRRSLRAAPSTSTASHALARIRAPTRRRARRKEVPHAQRGRDACEPGIGRTPPSSGRWML